MEGVTEREAREALALAASKLPILTKFANPLCPGEDAVKAAELRNLSGDELGTRVRDLTNELFRLRLQKWIGAARGARKVRDVRRDLARAKTVLRQKQGS